MAKVKKVEEVIGYQLTLDKEEAEVLMSAIRTFGGVRLSSIFSTLYDAGVANKYDAVNMSGEQTGILFLQERK